MFVVFRYKMMVKKQSCSDIAKWRENNSWPSQCFVKFKLAVSSMSIGHSMQMFILMSSRRIKLNYTVEPRLSEPYGRHTISSDKQILSFQVNSFIQCKCIVKRVYEAST